MSEGGLTGARRWFSRLRRRSVGPRGQQLLLTTAQALLEVRLDSDTGAWGIGNVRVLHTDLGIYFGLARSRDSVFAVARNRLDRDGATLQDSLPTDNILELDASNLCRLISRFSSPEWVDIHQIRVRDGLLWVVSGRAPELLGVSLRARSVIRRLALREYVPVDLRHPAPAEHPEDPYHFNSLHFARRRLFVLAHNWSQGSFCLEFAYRGPGSFFADPRLVHVWRGLGTMAHDVLLDDEQLVVLDSGRSLVVRTDGASSALRGDDGKQLFLRGLGATDSHLFIGAGEVHSERDRRAVGRTWIHVLDRPTLAPLASLDLGLFGNTMDVLALDAVHDAGFTQVRSALACSTAVSNDSTRAARSADPPDHD
jgi:hypothetical protein